MTQYKRKRIKTGPNSWINVTTRQDGTSSRSVSNKAGNTTTNISSRGVRRTQNNSGMVDRKFWSYKPKRVAKSKSSSFKWFGFGSSKKAPKKQFDSNKLLSDLERLNNSLDKSQESFDKLTTSEKRWALAILFVIILIIQLTMKSCS